MYRPTLDWSHRISSDALWPPFHFVFSLTSEVDVIRLYTVDPATQNDIISCLKQPRVLSVICQLTLRTSA